MAHAGHGFGVAMVQQPIKKAMLVRDYHQPVHFLLYHKMLYAFIYLAAADEMVLRCSLYQHTT